MQENLKLQSGKSVVCKGQLQKQGLHLVFAYFPDFSELSSSNLINNK